MSYQYTPLGSDASRISPPIQRRVTVRYRCSPATLGRLFLANSYQSLTAWVVNLSLTGVGLQVNQHLESGSWLLIELECSETQITLELSAKVMHSSRQADGNWLVGCQFARPLDADELEALL